MSDEYEISESIRRKAVNHCHSVADFAYKFLRPEKFTKLGLAYVEGSLRSLYQEILESGYVFISKHDSIIGESVTYIPSSEEMEDIKKIWPARIQAVRDAAMAKEMPEKQKKRGRGRPRKL